MTTEKPRMILNTGDFKVHFYPEANANAEYAYAVVNNDCDVIFESDDRDEATREARDEQDAFDKDQTENRLGNLKDQIGEELADCQDEETLKAILALLKASR
jgi:hypothetical protein